MEISDTYDILHSVSESSVTSEAILIKFNIGTYTYFIYFQSSGGKSGASFYKTTDGRFLLKQINKHEIDTFKSIAHKYFEYITSNDHRALMAKIVGLYTVGYKTINGGARRLDLVVMENLFHGHKIAESFDLKGSMRNRLVDPSGNNVQVIYLPINSQYFSKVDQCQPHE